MSRPTICLNMIVKNESHIVGEALEAVAPYIDCWVIVDTGSDDGTQDLIRSRMAELGVPGELHQRPWRDFGSNRSEALELAAGKADYIWVMDADDTIVGDINFGDLSRDAYMMRVQFRELRYWRPQLFRSGLPWRYVGVLHEYPTCDRPFTLEQLDGDYVIVGRHLGGRNFDPAKLERDRDILLASLDSDPHNSRSVFYLGVTYRAMGDHANARTWWARRTEMGGFDEEVYYAMLKLAEAMDVLGEPWPEVQSAYLRAWSFRPTRAEALYELAFHYRRAEEYELGYLFASRGAQIPLPETDVLFVQNDIHQWRLLDEQAVCASWIGRRSEGLRIERRLLTSDDLPDAERERIRTNRDRNAAELLETCTIHPADLARRPPPRPDAEVTVTLTVAAIRTAAERALNSFLRCCTDASRVGRFLIIDAGLTAPDREALVATYPFLDVIAVPDADLNVVREQIGGRYWLHLWHGWRFFTDEALITRMVDVFDAEPEVYQVGINLADAVRLSPDSPARSGVRTTARGDRYLLSATTPAGPAMFDMTRLERLLKADPADRSPEGITATLDEVLCVHD